MLYGMLLLGHPREALIADLRQLMESQAAAI
jgi:hypothetical protein